MLHFPNNGDVFIAIPPTARVPQAEGMQELMLDRACGDLYADTTIHTQIDVLMSAAS
jgi:hypothetical protein